MSDEKSKIVVISQGDCGKTIIVKHFKESHEEVDKRFQAAGCEVGENVNMWEIEIAGYRFTSFDVPGNFRFNDAFGCPDLTANMIRATSLADCVLLAVDSTSVDSRLIHELELLAHFLTPKRMIWCCTKIDATSPPYSEEKYEEIRDAISSCLKDAGYPAAKIRCVPISGLEGDNLMERSEKFPWYRGSTLIEEFGHIQCTNTPSQKSLRILLTQDAEKQGRNSAITSGVVLIGIVKPGMKLSIASNGLTAKVESTKINDRPVEEAKAGYTVHLELKKIDAKNLKAGCVASDSKNHPAKKTLSFTAMIIITNKTLPDSIIQDKPTIESHTYRGDVKIKKISKHSIFGKKAATVEMVPKAPMVVETFVECPQLGWFIMRDGEQIIGVGVIKTVKKRRIKGIKSAVTNKCKKLSDAMVSGGKKYGTVFVNACILAIPNIAIALLN